jgi:hypothetical protein
MTVSIEERLTAAEENVNRLFEAIQSAATVEDASDHTNIIDNSNQDILDRIRRIEQIIDRIKYQIRQMTLRK